MPRPLARVLAFLVLPASLAVADPSGSIGTTDLFEDAPDCIVHPSSGAGDFTSIQAAIDAALPGVPTRIRVHRAAENADDERIWEENIDFKGKPIVLYAFDGPGIVVIEGDGSGPVVTISGGDTSQAALIGFTITGGAGGVCIDNASPAIIACHIENNDAGASGGGGISVVNGDPLILNTTVYNNSADFFGGGVYLENADPDIIHCTIANNSVQDAGGAGGGIRAFAGSDPVILNSILWDNFVLFGADTGLYQLSVDGSSSAVVNTCTVKDGWTGGTNISTLDPDFVSPIASDLSPALSSPVIDRGDASFLPPDTYDLDLDGDTAEPTPLDNQLRLRRWEVPGLGPIAPLNNPDVGAHEYTPYNGGSVAVRRAELGESLWPVFDPEGVEQTTTYIPYSATHDLFEAPDAANQHDLITRLIIVVPSSGRGVNFSRLTITSPAADLGVLDRTLVVSPQFLETRDLALGGYGFQAPNILYWSQGWNRGLDAVLNAGDDGPSPPLGPYGDRDFTESSFAIVDEMIRHIVESGNFPNLEKIVLTGHSSGGQFTNRFSLTSRIEDEVVVPAGVAMRYVPTSPCCWTYLSCLRIEQDFPNAVDLRRGVRPVWDIPENCPEYDDYREGLGAPDGEWSKYPRYIRALGPDEATIRDVVVTQYERREVTVLIDLCDADPDDPISGECRYDIQGAHRYERAENFFANVVDFYGPHILGWQRIAIIDDDGCPDGFEHSSSRNYDSRMGRRWLFDVDTAPDATLPQADRVIHVDRNQPNTENGLSWNLAFRDLQDGLLATAAWGGDINQVWVANGVYRPDRGSGDRLMSFPIMNGVGIYGGFSGYLNPPDENDELSDRDPIANPCILSGDLNGDGPFTAEDSLHVLTGHFVGTVARLLPNPVSGMPPIILDADPILDGFTITRGNAFLDGALPVGDCGDLGLASSLQTDNAGGGLYVREGSPLLTNCEFTLNLAESLGGAVSLTDAANPRFVDCRFINNDADIGGAINAIGSSPVVIGSRFEDNRADDYGGAIALIGSGVPRIEASRFVNNLASGRGGAIATNGDLPGLINNSLFHSNDADFGAAISLGSITNADLVITCSTFVENVAPSGQGAALHNDGAAPLLLNSVLASNLSVPSDLAGDPITVDHCRLDPADLAAYPGSGNIDDLPLFVDANAGDFRLAESSPGIDAGRRANVPFDDLDLDGDGDTAEQVDLDLGAEPRFHDDPGIVPNNASEPPVDMGAFEFQGESPAPGCPGDIDMDGDTDVFDFAGLAAAFGSTPGDANWNPDADLNGDEVVDVFDFSIFAAALGCGL